MNAKALAYAIFVAFAICGGPAMPQGFSGLGQDAEGFAAATPGTEITFPEDHGPHEEFRIEWWYVTANLVGEDGRDYGAQWTLFRTALAPGGEAGWQSPVVWLGHAALTTPRAHYAAERYGRGGVGQAGVSGAPFEAFIDEWQMAGPSLSDINIFAQGPDFSYDLQAVADRGFVLQGDAGYSVKSPSGEASHYYSQPYYQVSGTIRTPQGAQRVTGQAWLDREWFSSILADGQPGWDWTALHLESGDKVMAFQVRGADGGAFNGATWIAANGAATPYDGDALRLTPLTRTEVAGREIPTRWRVELAARGLDVEIAAVNPGAWMDLTVPYWEGPVRVTGSHQGVGYLEMTGYE